MITVSGSAEESFNARITQQEQRGNRALNFTKEASSSRVLQPHGTEATPSVKGSLRRFAPLTAAFGFGHFWAATLAPRKLGRVVFLPDKLSITSSNHINRIRPRRATMSKNSYTPAFVGLDIAKNVFQASLANEKGKEFANIKLTRTKVTDFFANKKPCVIGIEACATAHYWGRTLTAQGHTVKLIKPERAKAFLGHHSKTDAADAKAICEAVMHPGTETVAIKSVEQQSLDFMFARRDRLISSRTEVINQTRAMLAELGIVIPQGINNFEANFKDLCAAHWDSFNVAIQSTLTDNYADYEKLSENISTIDQQIVEMSKQLEVCHRLQEISGIGALIALALVSAVGDAKQFKNGRSMSSYFGLVPDEYSSGGKQRLLGISKRGNQRIRTLLILAANAFMNGLRCRKKGEDGQPIKKLNALENWVIRLADKIGYLKAKVALANKLTRIAWVIIAKGEHFNAAKAAASAVAA